MVGSITREFVAFDENGGEHTIHVCDFLGLQTLYTDDDEIVIGLGNGRYQMARTPRVIFTTRGEARNAGTKADNFALI